MQEFDVIIEFGNYNYRQYYTVEAKDIEEAKKEALQYAYEDLTVVEVASVSDFYKRANIEARFPRFKRYVLRQIDKDGKSWTILESSNAVSLIQIAEHISLPNAERVEVIGTKDFSATITSYTVIFTKQF